MAILHAVGARRRPPAERLVSGVKYLILASRPTNFTQTMEPDDRECRVCRGYAIELCCKKSNHSLYLISSYCKKMFTPIHSGDEDTQELFMPCLCSGSIKYVHEACLKEWLRFSKTNRVRNHMICIHDQRILFPLPIGLLVYGR